MCQGAYRTASARCDMLMDPVPLEASGEPSMVCALLFTLAAALLTATAAQRRLWMLSIVAVASASIVGVVEMRRDEIPGADVLRFGATAAAIWVAVAIALTRRIARWAATARALRMWRADLFGWLGTLIVRLGRQIHSDGGLIQPSCWSGDALAAESLAGAVALSLFLVPILFGPPLLVMALGRIDRYHRDPPMPRAHCHA